MQGELFVEATQTFSSWVYQSVRIFHNLPIVEFEFTVGPIPIKYVPMNAFGHLCVLHARCENVTLYMHC